jgi:hypothetical protein
MELTTRQRNRALLARQLLLERKRIPLVRAVEQMGGIQAQYAPSAYIGLWSRLEAFERSQLTRALEQRRLIQATLMRGTIHVVSRADYWPFHEGIREAQQRWFLRVHKIADERVPEKAGQRLRAVLEGKHLRRDELIQLATKEVWDNTGVDPPLVRVPPTGTWEKRRADLFVLAEDWLGPSTAGAEAGRDLLLRRYLGAFGPARVLDAADWMSVPVTMLRPAVERAKLRHFRDESGAELIDLPRAPLPPADTPAPPRFIPTWDATLLVHARATGILPEEYRPLIFNTKSPQSFSTFTVDGAVAGTWKVGRAKEKATLVLSPFAPLPPGARRELVAEGERLVRWHEDDATSYKVSVAAPA